MPSHQEPLPSLDDAAEAAAREIARQYEAAVAELRRSITDDAVAAALAIGSASAYVTPDAFAAFVARIEAIFGETGPLAQAFRAAAAGMLAEPPLLGLAFDVAAIDAAAIDWIRTEGARLVVEITDETRKAISELVARAYQGRTSELQAVSRAILRDRLVGLTSAQTRALVAWRAKLERAVRRAKVGDELHGLARRRIDALTRSEYRRKLRRRANLIAQTEAYTAGNEAQQRTIVEAVRQGTISKAEYVRQWVTRGINVCPRCLALRGKIAEIEGDGSMFVSDPVASGTYQGQVIVIGRPTVHPGCYCGTRTRRRADVMPEDTNAAG